MKIVGIVDAKARLSELVSAVEAVETILLARNGRPVASLVAAPVDREKAHQAVKWIFNHRPRKPCRSAPCRT
ncbi:MAG: type II toxin-antitoxin system prevent-host-death family antitoxin [Candidatus Eremiobacteraeota bacterium]|nr:type II toxin-antitoxin system prevent-host-death family antitoxin [Candidatus Eremiobacteraeota bacterium]